MASTDSEDFSGFVTGDKYFEVPPYQRNYSWEKEHVNDLWSDLVEAVEMDRDHYIGTFLLMDAEENEGASHKIIDGQQRLTTLTILLFEIQEVLDEYGEENTARQIRGDYIARFGEQKLTLAGDDERFFRRTILENVLNASRKGQREDELSDTDTDSPSQGRLLKAKKTLRENLSKNELEKISVDDPLEFYKALYQKIRSLPLLEYTVGSRSEAARIFQTVNDRGKDLTDLEITKSYLMHRVSLLEDEQQADSSIQTIQESFDEIYDSVDNISSGPSEDQIQRYHFIMWNADWGTGYDSRYYQNHLEHLKDYFRKVGDTGEIITYVQELERIFQLLDELYNHETNDSIDSKRLEDCLRDLFVAGRLGNFYPLLMAAYDQYKQESITEEEFCTLLRKIETFIVRTYVIEQKSADTGRTRVYPRARELYYNNKDEVLDSIIPCDVNDVISRLEQYIHDYCSDAKLDTTLGDSNVFKYYGNRKSELRLLLYAYEWTLERKKEGYQFDVKEVVGNKDGNYSIEHVWPQTPKEGFDDSTKELVNEHKHRLGNLALMTPEDNAVQGNSPFRDKKAEFSGSKIRMLEEIFSEPEWGVEQISNREERMLSAIRERWPDEYADA
ncbi:DUF262 domain-containing HNH endonuclease family protein [Haloarcula sp. S1CR25-12]|uniref:DUF262 domain-containing HNH endonuclease family protein n=1 Tax=Haloarcula saliterrae TaxID=2950534 RepID=A0ABU2FGW2_9EURY|nr:DUF262 domain-containing HNH endonuclease family protein [Haloarcula sp. S1CR25-12]MDS0261494.1 DUF262 domain-containing HNH endonuclease family protein [Haloarcula sp. S1CR25-12]